MAVAEPTARVFTTPWPASRGVAVYPPRITANRRQLDNRFPALGFSVDTGGLPYFEVLLATDATLFDPNNAARRAVANFYSSRQDGGLLPAAQAAHPFLVPAAVIRGFASATPRPSAIYYTLLAYQDKDGAGPAFALDPTMLATQAPSVGLARDFTATTLATVLGISVDKLQRPMGPNGAPVPPNPAEDAGEGEDGYGAPQPADQQAQPMPVAAPAPTPSPAPASGRAQEYEPSGDFELAMLPAPPAPPAARTDRPRPHDPTLPGQTSTRPGSSVPMDLAQSTDFGTEAEEPGYLPDGDDNENESYRSATAQELALAIAEADPQLDAHPGYFQSLDAAPTPTPTAEPAAAPLTVDDKMRIIDRIAPFESNGDYGAVNADGEFAGKFGTNHPAYQHYHVGLSYGLIQFTQDSGKLGELLRTMRARDAAAFAQVFGPDGDELVRVTTSSGPGSSHSPGGRSARVQPVAGVDLWQEPWVSRFRAAAQNDKFKAAQREIAARGYLDPVLEFAGWLGLNSERALTMVVDRAVQMGVGGAKRWIISAVGPVGSEAQRQQALTALGYQDLRGFQAATHGLVADGAWGPNTHAAMVAALRRLGAASPIPIPTTEQMVEAMVRRAASEPWHARVETLQHANIADVRFQL